MYSKIRGIAYKYFENYPNMRRFIKFGIIGFLGTVIDFSFLNLFVQVFHFNVYVSATFSFIIAVVNNFLQILDF